MRPPDRRLRYLPQLRGVDVNASPNAWYHGDTAVIRDSCRLPIYVRIVAFERGLVRVEHPDGATYLRPFGALNRIEASDPFRPFA